MKKKGVLVISILILLMIFPVVLALDTQINIKTAPNADVHLRIGHPEKGGTLTLEDGDTDGYFNQEADSSGVFSAIYSSKTMNKISLSIMVKNSAGTTIQQPLFFKDIKTGWTYNLDLTKANPTPIQGEKIEGELEIKETNENTTKEIEVVEESEEVNNSEETEEIKESEEETNSPITGLAIKENTEDGKYFFNLTTYIIAGIVIIIIVIFIFFYLRKKPLIKKENIKITKLSDKLAEAKTSVLNEVKEDKNIDEQELEDAERKLKEAEREIQDIRNKKNKLYQAEKEYEQAKARLEQIKQGEQNTF